MSGIHLRIADLRKRDNMTQQELADRLGVTYQAVSKWETGVTMPDISLLPELSQVFSVSVDELLGLKPLADLDYRQALSGTPGYWGERLDYLKRSRRFLWNEDYIRFLIREVWRMEAPVRVLDCGCGYGAAGLLMMPHLPEGSTYTGVDFDRKLLEEGKRLFLEAGISGTFLEADVMNMRPGRRYDVAVSQAVLRHIDQAAPFLKKMTEAVTENGLVISIEGNREAECSGLYVEGLEYADLCENGGLRSMWKREYERQGRDYAAAVKVPGLMRRLGLSDIQVRFNDRVTVFPEAYSMEADSAAADSMEAEGEKSAWRDFLEMNGWGRPVTEKEAGERISYFMNHGMERTEAESYVCRQQVIAAALNRREENGVVQFTGMMIASGRKRNL